MTRHSCNAGDGPYFGRLSPADCARCRELEQGATRRSWTWVDARKRQREIDAERNRAIRAHDCKHSNCGPVCTAFDW